ncbi:hypothetical protein SteCoe_478 [Stentor coeruleus]|uniref:Uncharacterized protein n=1 Tax=Stentor coeruleus TaxID=5963 RepID=A0A1R2D4A4_9CILI|nr:hypothetical protein SteCoe_478 [Stentor coeruleus]
MEGTLSTTESGKGNTLFSIFYKDLQKNKVKYLENFRIIIKSEGHSAYHRFLSNIFLSREKEQDSTTLKKLKKINPTTKEVIYNDPYLQKIKANIEFIKEINLIDEFIEEEIVFELLILLPFGKKTQTLILNNIPLGIKALFFCFCDSLLCLWNLKHLSLANCKLSQVSNFKNFSISLCFLRQLVYLNLSCNELNSVMLYKIFTFEIEIEDKNKNYITLDSISESEFDNPIEIKVFSYMFKLININISYYYYRVSDTPSSLFEDNKILMLSLISQLNLLKELHLSNLGLGMSLNALAQIVNRLSNLEKLDLSNNYITDSNFANFIEGIIICENLNDLKLTKNMIGSDGFLLMMNNMNKFRFLRLLDFGHINITKLYKVIQINDTFNIFNFNISHNCIARKLKVFEKNFSFLMRAFQKIHTLIAVNCGIDNNCFEFIIKRSRSINPKMYYFDLRKNNIDMEVRNVIQTYDNRMIWFAKLLLKPKIKKKLTMYLRTSKYRDKFL